MFRIERNWRIIDGRKHRIRGWTLRAWRLYVRYGRHFDYYNPPEFRLTVYWLNPRPENGTPTSTIFVLIFPRIHAGE